MERDRRLRVNKPLPLSYAGSMKFSEFANKYIAKKKSEFVEISLRISFILDNHLVAMLLDLVSIWTFLLE